MMMRAALHSLQLLQPRNYGIEWHTKKSYNDSVKNWAQRPGSFCV